MKIKFNVTTSYNWRGSPVGIVRTEIEILKAIRKLPGVQLSLFIIENESVYPLTFEDYEKGKSVETPHAVIPVEPQKEYVVPLVSKKEALKRLAQASLSLSPEALRPAINLVANSCAGLLRNLCIKGG